MYEKFVCKMLMKLTPGGIGLDSTRLISKYKKIYPKSVNEKILKSGKIIIKMDFRGKKVATLVYSLLMFEVSINPHSKLMKF
jgi:hypothetical protein